MGNLTIKSPYAALLLLSVAVIGPGCAVTDTDISEECLKGKKYAVAKQYDRALLAWAPAAYDQTPKERLRKAIECLKEIGIAGTDAQIVAWYERAIDIEPVKTEAMIHLALLYFNGVGTQPDVRKATDLLRRAEAQGDRRASAMLAVLSSH